MAFEDERLAGLTDGHPDAGSSGVIPVARVRDKVDEFTAIPDYGGAARLLEYWRAEARALRDLRGEFVVLNEMMGVYRKMEDREKAAQSAEAAMAMIPELGMEDSISAGTAYVNAGTVFDFCGDPEKSLACFQKAQPVYEAHLGRDDGRLGGLYNNMALALAGVKRYGEAREYCALALEIMGEQPNGGLEQAITWLNMANIAEAEKGLEAAEEEIADYLGKGEALLADPALPRNAYYAFVIEKCAPTFSYYGWFQTAAELEKAAEKIRGGR